MIDFQALQHCLLEYEAPSGKEEDISYWKNRCQTPCNSWRGQAVGITKTYMDEPYVKEFNRDRVFRWHHFDTLRQYATKWSEIQQFSPDSIDSILQNGSFWVYFHSSKKRLFLEYGLPNRFGVNEQVFLCFGAISREEFDPFFHQIAEIFVYADTLTSKYCSGAADSFLLKAAATIWDTMPKGPE